MNYILLKDLPGLAAGAIFKPHNGEWICPEIYHESEYMFNEEQIKHPDWFMPKSAPEELTKEDKELVITEALNVACRCLLTAMKLTGYENYIKTDIYMEEGQKGDKYSLDFRRNDFKD